MGGWLALGSKVRGWLIGAGAVLAALAVAYLKGRKDQQAQEYENDINDYVETRRRIDENTIPNDATAAREWLRKRQDK